MPVEFGVWRIDDGLRQVSFDRMTDERRLEKILAVNLSILGLEIMVIGRQIPTAFGKRIDLLGIDQEGQLYVIELKRDRTPRDVVAQVLDYGSWIRGLGYDDIAGIFSEHNDHRSFEAAFDQEFGANPPESLNETHQLVIVASELDASTERIVGYLSEDYGVPINAVFFRYMTDNGAEYLVRSWLIDPQEVEDRPARANRETWNKRDFYISFGHGQYRSWQDARRYGFVSGGGGKWYTRTLYSLEPGNRVFVHIPQQGYVGVGTVVEKARPVDEFDVSVDGETVPILEAPLERPMDEWLDDSDRVETLVRVEWIRTLNVEDAIWENGFFANQNTACKLRNRFTIERLVERFGLDE